MSQTSTLFLICDVTAHSQLAEVINHSSFACADVYLLGTVMLVFGMGLYELFVSTLDSSKSLAKEKLPYRSNLFGLFPLKVS